MFATLVPPTEAEKLSYIEPNGKLLGLAGLLCLSLFGYTTYCFMRVDWPLLLYGLFAGLYLLNLGYCSVGALCSQRFDPESLLSPSANPTYQPTVDIFLPNCGEPLALLEQTFPYFSQLDYPTSLYTVWVLDDAKRPEVKALAEQYHYQYLARPTNELKKAGNLRYAFPRSEGELIAVFDADFVPRSDFLSTLVPQFQDPSIGIVQTPQYFELSGEQSPIQRGASFLQAIFYRLVQNFRNQVGASICCGSNAVYRRAALAPHGGAAAVERSEDVNTGITLVADGWRTVYIPLNLAKGLSPDTIQAFFHQHYRWCSGSVHLIIWRVLWLRSLPPVVRLSFTISTAYYLTSGLGTFCFPLPTLINAWFYPDHMRVSNYTLVFPSLVLLALARSAWAKTTLVKPNDPYAKAFQPWSLPVLVAATAATYTHLTALTDLLLKDVGGWVPTNSSATHKTSPRYKRFLITLLALPTLSLLLFLAGAWMNQLPLRAVAPGFLWFSLQLFLSYRVLLEAI